MKTPLATAVILAVLTVQATAAEWWHLDDSKGRVYGFSSHPPLCDNTPDTRATPRIDSPRLQYLLWQQEGLNPTIKDTGEEVAVVAKDGYSSRYFRTESGCRVALKALQAEIEAVDATRKAEAQKLDKYR